MLNRKLVDLEFVNKQFISNIVTHHIAYEDTRNVVINIQIKEETK
jgi:hypothetical protein